MFFHEGHVFLEKKAPGRAAPNRRPNWGCTTPPISNPNPPFPIKIHQLIQSSIFRGRRQRRQPINPPRHPLRMPYGVLDLSPLPLQGSSSALEAPLRGDFLWKASPKPPPYRPLKIETNGICTLSIRKLGFCSQIMILPQPHGPRASAADRALGVPFFR